MFTTNTFPPLPLQPHGSGTIQLDSTVIKKKLSCRNRPWFSLVLLGSPWFCGVEHVFKAGYLSYCSRPSPLLSLETGQWSPKGSIHYLSLELSSFSIACFCLNRKPLKRAEHTLNVRAKFLIRVCPQPREQRSLK